MHMTEIALLLFVKQKTAYEMRMSDWSSDVCSSDLAEKDKLGDAQKLKEQLDAARLDLEQAQRKSDWNRASELSYGVIPQLEQKLKDAEAAGGDGAKAMVQEAVTDRDNAGAVSRWTERTSAGWGKSVSVGVRSVGLRS